MRIEEAVAQNAPEPIAGDEGFSSEGVLWADEALLASTTALGADELPVEGFHRGVLWSKDVVVSFDRLQRHFRVHLDETGHAELYPVNCG